jgi:cytochrome c peroxidase
MKKIIATVIVLFIVLLGFTNARTKGDDISIKTPKGWPEPYYKFEKNKLTKAGFELGRKLFYDPRISRNNTVSCGSCHQPFAAFSHLDHAVSHGIENKMGMRNAPPLFNLIWQTSFMWDGGINHIEVQPLAPMTNPVEMDQSLDILILKLKADAQYKTLFKNAFRTEEINTQRIFKALAQFMGALISDNSKYDKYIRKEKGGEMTASELNGLAIFREKCASCHKEPLFSDFSYRNNGLEPKYKVNDSGRAHITRTAEDMYKFKVPSLRNLKYTAPYMHDGRFSELSQVIEHYTHTKYLSQTLDIAVRGIYLTAKQKEDLLAFLNTLSDEDFVKNQLFKDADNKTDMSNMHHNSGKP